MDRVHLRNGAIQKKGAVTAAVKKLRLSDNLDGIKMAFASFEIVMTPFRLTVVAEHLSLISKLRFIHWNHSAAAGPRFQPG